MRTSLLAQADQAAGLQQAVSDGANDVLTAYARSARTAVPKLAQAIQTPTLRPETLLEVAESIDEQARGIEDAVRFGRARRAEVVTAIVKADAALTGSAQRLGGAVAELVTQAQQPVSAPAAPQLPAVVLERAP